MNHINSSTKLLNFKNRKCEISFVIHQNESVSSYRYSITVWIDHNYQLKAKNLIITVISFIMCVDISYKLNEIYYYSSFIIT